MNALWTQLQNEIRRQMALIGARAIPAGAASAGKRKLRLDPASTDETDELFAMLKGLPKIAAGDELAVIVLGGKNFILGSIQNSAQTEIVYDLPIVAEKGVNSPYTEDVTISNSAVTPSTASTTTYSVNIQNTSFDLPTGTWNVLAWGDGFYAHSAVNGVVRVHLQVGNDAGTALTMNCQQDPGRSSIGISNFATGQTGSIEIRMEYRPNASGTAYAGGGWLTAIAWRTA